MAGIPWTFEEEMFLLSLVERYSLEKSLDKLNVEYPNNRTVYSVRMKLERLSFKLTIPYRGHNYITEFQLVKQTGYDRETIGKLRKTKIIKPTIQIKRYRLYDCNVVEDVKNYFDNKTNLKKDYFTVQQARKFLNVSKQTILHKLRNNELPFIIIDNGYFIDKIVLNAYKDKLDDISKNYLSILEISKRLGVSRGTVKYWIKVGTIDSDFVLEHLNMFLLHKSVLTKYNFKKVS